MSPVFGSVSPPYYAQLYGAEYQTYDNNNHHDPLCSVCRTSHATTIMIPGTNVCSSGWTKQYDGFLMADSIGDSSSEFVCVDTLMESRAGSGDDLNGALFYYTFTHCGSLPCGPYQDTRVVTCVVCSK
jgi:hypothetical protein